MDRISGAARIVTIAIVLCAVQPAVAQTNVPPPQIAVSPSKFEIELGGKPTVESLRIFNMGRDPVTVAVNVATWDLDAESRVRIVEPTEQTLDQWLVINPLQFTVGAGQSQAIRFSIRPRVQPEPGEHRAMIYLTEQPRADATAPVTVRFRLGIAVYGYAGDATRIGALHSVDVDASSRPLTAVFDISSEGNSHVRLRGQYAIWPAAAYPGPEQTEPVPKLELPETPFPESILDAEFLPTTPVLASTRREIVLRTHQELPPGDYVLDLNADLGGTTIDEGIRFSVTAPPPSPTPETGPAEEEVPEKPTE